MTPAKQKAKELIEKYLKLAFGIIEEYIPIPLKFAKQCALIAVEEILKVLNDEDLYIQGENNINDFIEFYKEVRQEILNYENRKSCS